MKKQEEIKDTAYLVLHKATGTIAHEFDTEETNAYYTSKKQSLAYKQKMIAKEQFDRWNESNGKFIWSKPDSIQYLIQSDDFTKEDVTRICYLATFINGTGYLSHDNNVKMNKNDIHNKLNISRKRFLELYKKLVNHEIMFQDEYGYLWNKEFNFYGKTYGIANPNKLVRSYVNQIRCLYESKKAGNKPLYSASALYPVFALVPHLHYSTNIICENPYEPDVDKIVYYNLTDIAGLLQLNDSKKMSKSITSLLLNEQTVFTKTESKNEQFIRLNPAIFWRSSDAPDEKFVAEFRMIDNNRKWKAEQKGKAKVVKCN